MKKMQEFYSDLRRKYPQINPNTWRVFRLDRDGRGVFVDIFYRDTPITNEYVAFGGSTSQNFAELKTLAANAKDCVIVVEAKRLYEDEREAVQAALPAADPRATALTLSEQAIAYRITDQATFLAAGEIAKEIKRMQKVVEDHFAPMVDSAYKTHREICTQRAKHIDPLKDAERAIKNAMASFKAGEERRIAEERRAQEAARAQEVAAYEQHKQEITKGLVAEGKVGEAMRVAAIDTALAVPDLPPPVVAPKADGIYTRTTYNAEVYDVAALIRAASEHVYLECYITPNQKALDAAARAYKGGDSKIPGVRFVAKETVGVRT
jgi:hypothetical protein